jgi:serine/threonine-protein kinase
VSEESPGGPGDFAAGSLVAGYQLAEQIGRGGMAVVYRAHDPRLDRDVALKILAPGLSQDEAFRQRFIRESRAAAGVDEPHIIPVYEAGEDRGVLFIAMRFVRGGDIRSLLDRDGPLSPGRATEIVSQVASALDAAHARGLVHRDVKPANMLLEESPDSDRPDHVYLADFGLTKASLGQAAAGLTSTGQFLGTLDYVAPEQIEGRPVDGRTDLYALGCAAFEMLTGAPPFRSNEGMAVMYKQVSQAPPLLSSRRPGLAREADEVFNRALAKRPEDRYQSCREFAAALRRVFGLRPESAPRPQPHLRPATEIAAPIRRPADRPAPGEDAAAGGQGPDAAGSQGPGETEVSNLPGGAGEPGASPASPDDAAGEPGGGPASPGAPGPGAAPAGTPGPAAAPQPAGAGSAGAPAARGAAGAGAAAPGSPGAADAGPAGAAAASAGGPGASDPAGRPGQSGGDQAEPASGGPPTQAADIRRPTRPGLTDPSARAGGPGGGGYGGPGGPGGSGSAPGGRRRSPWYRSPVPIAVICALIVIIGGGAFFLVGHHGGTSGGGHAGGAFTSTNCASSAPSTKTIDLKSDNVQTGPSPFAVRESTNGQYSFVSVKDEIEVWRNQSGQAPSMVRTITVPGANKGLAITSNGQYLLSANGQGAVVINAANAESGASPMVLGTMAAPNLSTKGNNAIGVQVTPDNNFVFVTMQNTTKMAVFNLSKAISGGFTKGYLVGYVPLHVQPVGISSPSKSSPWTYVTSFQRKDTGDRPSVGTLSVINWKTAETQPGKSVKSTVNAGCSPARVVLTGGGSTVWVTARDSNSLLAFSAGKLISDPGHALLADIPVGPGPIGLSPADGGKKLIVADSNYATSNDGKTGKDGQLAIVDTADVLNHKPIVIQLVGAMGQPRQVTLATGGDTLLVTEQNPSDAPHEPGQLQMVNIGKLS